MKGVFVATATPFKKDGSVDLHQYEKHLEFLASHRVHGFLACATTGESPTIKPEERTSLLKATATFAQSKGLLAGAGCGGPSTDECLKKIEDARELGCNVALVVTPYYNRPTATGLLAHYKFLADRSPIPMILYQVPGRTQVTIPVEVVAELLQHPRIIGIKEATGQHAYWLSLMASVDRKNRAVLAGDDDAFATLSAMGACGIISASANLVPHLYVKLFDLTQNKKWEEAFELQIKLNSLVRALFSETSPAPLKYALSKTQNWQNVLRLPLVPVQKYTEALLDKLLKEWELLA